MEHEALGALGQLLREDTIRLHLLRAPELPAMLHENALTAREMPPAGAAGLGEDRRRARLRSAPGCQSR